MTKIKYYIDFDYDKEKDGPSNGSRYHPFKTATQATEEAEKLCVDDFILIDIDEDNSGSKWFRFLNLEGCAVWSLILLIGGSILYFIIITLVEFFRNLGS